MATATINRKHKNKLAKIEEIRHLTERQWLKADQGVEIEAYYPFADFYGGYLVYTLNGQKYKMWCGNLAAGQLGAKIIHVYGVSA
jgi:hypothetical protein